MVSNQISGERTNFYDEIPSNKWKSVFLLFIFLVLISSLGLAFGAYIGSIEIGLILAGIITVFMILVGYYAGDNAILSMSHAVPAEKEKYPHFVNTVEGLAIAAGVPMPRVYVIEDTAINAFATGRDPKHASITATTGALQRLNRTELEGVIAHEMSHIKNYDVRVMMFAAIFAGIIILLSDIFLRSMLYGRGRRDSRSGRNGGAAVAIIIVAGLVLAILSPIIAQLIKLAVSRKREFLADANGALLTRHPAGLASALKKIRDDKEPLVEAANKATAHMFIENPLRTFGGKMNRLFSTHPDVNERIRKLESM